MEKYFCTKEVHGFKAYKQTDSCSWGQPRWFSDWNFDVWTTESFYCSRRKSYFPPGVLKVYSLLLESRKSGFLLLSHERVADYCLVPIGGFPWLPIGFLWLPIGVSKGGLPIPESRKNDFRLESPRGGFLVLLTNGGNIKIGHKHMNVGSGTEAAQFIFWKYINRNFFAVWMWGGNNVEIYVMCNTRVQSDNLWIYSLTVTLHKPTPPPPQ